MEEVYSEQLSSYPLPDDEPGGDPRIDHSGRITLGGVTFSAGLTELDGHITELEISPEENASFLGIPFGSPTGTFTDALTAEGIKWADNGRMGIVLYEKWITLYNHYGAIRAILWHNPEYVSELDMLEKAFPSKESI
mgnify:FL=1